jgi:NADH-quinone oxidoreductase subunit G
MEVKSDSSRDVEIARHAVQELLLLNHPVDCPICDQAGECDLQDYWLEHQRTGTRMHQEPVHKPKAAVFGPTIVYDGERCIMCTRCIRVCEEVAQDPVLDMRERGNRNEIALAPGRTLENDYTLMTEHVCPVGALTSSHFRFKARVWFLRTGRSICQGCATGCNAYLDYDPRDNTPYRYRPRDNPHVNKYWMCDEGMLSYTRAHERRLLGALVGSDDASVLDALDAATKQFAGHRDHPAAVAVALSAEHSIEDNYALAVLAKTYLGLDKVYLARRPDGRGDNILMSADKNPNGAGARDVARRLGLGDPLPFADLVAAVAAGEVRYLVSLGSEIDSDDAEARRQLARLKGYVAICSHEGTLSHAAHVALPACSWAEVGGRYVNRQGLTQKSDAVLDPLG